MTPHRKTTEQTKNDWRTPPKVAAPIINRFRFTGDAAASAVNTLAPVWLDQARCALKSDWSDLGSRVWLNPPYSMTRQFIKKARLESQNHGRVVVCLIPSTIDVKWFHAEAMPYAQEVWFYSGRISFIHPESSKPVTGNPVGSMLLVFDGRQSYAGPRLGTLCSKTGQPIEQADSHYWKKNEHGKTPESL